MDTVKNIFKPGGNKDDEILYGAGTQDPNRGKIAGEGSHFPKHGHHDSGIDVASPTSPTQKREFPLRDDNTGKTTTVTPATHTTHTATSPSEWPLKDTSKRETNILEQQKDVVDTRADGSAPARASQIPGDLEGPVHNSKILNELDPRVKEHPGSATTGGHHTVPKVGETHHDHAARDTAIGASAGAGTTAAIRGGEKYYDAPQGENIHQSSTSQVISQPEISQPTTTDGPGVEYRTLDPKADTSYSNRTTTEPPNTASGIPVMVGQQSAGHIQNSATPNTGATATAAGTGAVATAGISEKSSGPPGSDNRLDEPGLAQRSAVQHHATGPAVTQSVAAQARDAQSTVSHSQQVQPKQEEHHYGRDAAIVGGAGAAGAYGAHEISKHDAKQEEKEQKQHEKELHKEHEKAEKQAEKEQKQHEKELQKEHEKAEKQAEKEHAAAVKQADKEQKEAQKEAEKEQRKHHEAVVAEQKKAEKDAKKQEKEEQKAHEKAQKEAEKEQRKEHEAIVAQEKQAEKDAEKARKEQEKEQKKLEKEQKPGLVDRLLHRNKDDKDEEHEKHKHEAEGAAAGAGAAAVVHKDHDKELEHTPASSTSGPDVPARKSSQRNKLHKDPPAGYAAAPSGGYASQVTGGTGTTALAQGDSRVPTGTDDTVIPGTRYGSGHDEHVYHAGDASQGVKQTSAVAAGGTVASTTPMKPAPQSGYASQVTGGTGTTQLAEGDREPITNPRKDDPLHDGPKGYAAQVTGGTGTTRLAQGTDEAVVPTQVPGQVAGVTTETPYVDGSKGGYAGQVTGGTGTSMLAQGDQDPVTNPDTNPRRSSIVDKVKGVLQLS